MHIKFSREAAVKLNEIIGEEASLVVIRGDNCNSCLGGGVQLILLNHEDAPHEDTPSEMEYGISNNLDWACLKSEIGLIDGTEIDFKTDKAGQFFEIYNQGRYISFSIEQLVNSPVL